MRIGILETGPVNPALIDQHGPYTPMFDRFLKRADPSIETFAVLAYEGALPNIHDADGWMITGSAYGAYEDHAWLPAFEQFLRDAIATGVPIGGICFGHQILAQALGGKVVKSDKGWGLGAQHYTLENAPTWASPIGASFTNFAVHQDQVVEVPPTGTVLATNTFCQNAALFYGDANAPQAITVQPHPEFEAGFVEDIIDLRKGHSFTKEQAESARATLTTPTSSQAWAEVFVKFFKDAVARNAA
ncbi:MAG: type 1 glutamine amidotransferase [Pseudomonadota bacterium]